MSALYVAGGRSRLECSVVCQCLRFNQSCPLCMCDVCVCVVCACVSVVILFMTGARGAIHLNAWAPSQLSAAI